MKFEKRNFLLMAVAGFSMAVIGVWLMVSQISPIIGAVIFMAGAFMFLLGRKGSLLMMEKDIRSANRRKG